MRRDLADVFCTSAEGVQGGRAKAWGLVDAVVKPDAFDAYVNQRALELAALSDRPARRRGVALTPLSRDRRCHRLPLPIRRRDVRRAGGAAATVLVKRPKTRGPQTLEDILAAGAAGGRCRWRANWTTPS